MKYILRPYQQQAVDASTAYLNNHKMVGRNGIVVAPTGSGKSLLIASIIDKLDGPCLVFQPSKEILQQNSAKLVSYGYLPRIFSASLNSKNIGEVTLATVGSVVRYADAFREFKYIIIDECHLVNSKDVRGKDGEKRSGMYKQVLEAISGVRVLGLTATPYRLASNSFGSELRFLTRTRPRIFKDVVHITQIDDLFRDGYLSPIRWKIVNAVDQSKLRLNSTGSDFTDESVKQYYGRVGFADRLATGVQNLLDYGIKSIVVFTRFVEEAENLVNVLGNRAACVDAKTPAKKRDEILNGFKSGAINVVSNVGIIALGFDFPGLEAVVLARPTLSLAIYYQQVGRGIRISDSKDNTICVDMVGNVARFGKIETMRIKPGGKRGEKWAVWNNGKQLTNVCMQPLPQFSGAF